MASELFLRFYDILQKGTPFAEAPSCELRSLQKELDYIQDDVKNANGLKYCQESNCDSVVDVDLSGCMEQIGDAQSNVSQALQDTEEAEQVSCVVYDEIVNLYHSLWGLSEEEQQSLRANGIDFPKKFLTSKEVLKKFDVREPLKTLFEALPEAIWAPEFHGNTILCGSASGKFAPAYFRVDINRFNMLTIYRYDHIMKETFFQNPWLPTENELVLFKLQYGYEYYLGDIFREHRPEMFSDYAQ